MSIAGLAFDVNASVEIPVQHPKTRQPLRDANGKEAYIRVVSLDSPEVRKVQAAVTDKRLKARGRVTVTAAELEAERAEVLVAATKGWYLVGFDGAAIEFPFTEANARLLYSDASFSWIREQVDGALEDRATFL